MFRRSVSSLMAKFDKLSDQLIAEAEALRGDAAKLDMQVVDLEVRAYDLDEVASEKRAEADRALRVAARIDSLIA